MTEQLRRSGADNIVVLLDACRNEGRRSGLGIGDDVQSGVITLFSCSPQEASYEIDELKHGAFTHVLLNGLRLQGEGNCATVERLDKHLSYYLPQVNQRYAKPKQTPRTKVDPPAKYYLVLLPRHADVRDADILKMEAYKAEAHSEYELADQLWTRVLAVSPADPDAIQAIRRLTEITFRGTDSTDVLPGTPPLQFIKECSYTEDSVVETTLNQKIVQSMRHRTLVPLLKLLGITVGLCMFALVTGSPWLVAILGISAGVLLFLYVTLVILSVLNFSHHP